MNWLEVHQVSILNEAATIKAVATRMRPSKSNIIKTPIMKMPKMRVVLKVEH